MGVIETEYSEIRQLRQDIIDGKIDHEKAALIMKTYTESGKRVDQYIKVVALTINHGKSARQIIAKNIISEGTAIDVCTPQIQEKIKCPAKGDRLVSRDECLDFSGESRNIDKCQKCDNFITTRRQLAP